MITAFAPTYVRRQMTGAPKSPPLGLTPDSLVLVRGLDDYYAQLVRKFGIQHEATTSLKLVSARSKTLDIKSYTEYFGAVKYFDNTILKRQYQLKPDEGLMEWKSVYYFTITSFDDQGRIDDEYRWGYPRQIKEKDRILNVAMQDIDKVMLPKMRLGWEVRAENGKYAFCRAPTYYI